VESEKKSDSDSGRCSRNTVELLKGLEKNLKYNNDKCRVASEDCAPWNSTYSEGY